MSQGAGQQPKMQWSQGFSGDFRFTQVGHRGSTYSGKLRVNILAEPRGMRQDIRFPDGSALSTIWRQDRRDSVWLDPSEKVFWEVPHTSEVQVHKMTDLGPLALPEFMGKEVSKRLVGSGVIGGRRANNWSVVARDRSGGIADWDYWDDDRLHICLRASIAGQKEYVLVNIREGKQPASLFVIPAGFRKVEDHKEIVMP